MAFILAGSFVFFYFQGIVLHAAPLEKDTVSRNWESQSAARRPCPKDEIPIRLDGCSPRWELAPARVIDKPGKGRTFRRDLNQGNRVVSTIMGQLPIFLFA